MHRRLPLLLLLLLWCVPAVAAPAARLRISADGAPLAVNALARTPDGFVWIAGAPGVGRYAGRRCTWLPGLPKAAATALATRESVVYAGFADGTVWRIPPAGPPALLLTDSARNRISCLLPVGDGGLLAGTEGGGLLVWLGGRTRRVSTHDGLSDDYIHDLETMDAPGGSPLPALALATDNGVNLLTVSGDSLRITVLNTRTLPAMPDNLVTALCPGYSSGGLFCGTDQRGVFELYRRDGAWRVSWDTAARLRPACGAVRDLISHKDSPGALAATDSGLYYWVPDNLFQRSTTEPVRTLCALKDGTLLLGDAQGLALCLDGLLNALSLDGLDTGGEITAVLHNPSGLFVACGDVLHYYWAYGMYPCLWTPPKNHAPLHQMLKLPHPITSLHGLPGGDGGALMAGTLGGGLYRLSASPQGFRLTGTLLPGEHILSMAVQGDTLWAATLNGVFALARRGDDFLPPLRFNRAQGMGSDYIYQLRCGTGARLWLATDGAGLRCREGGRFLSFPVLERQGVRVVWSIAQDEEDHLWIAGPEYGIRHFDGHGFQSIGPREGLADLNVLGLAHAGSGHMLALHAGGLDEWMPRNSAFRHFELPGVAGGGVLNNQIAPDARYHGGVFIGVGRGVYFAPARGPGMREELGVRILSAQLFLKDVVAGQSGFGPADNHLTFRYEGAALTNPAGLRYRYRLDGFSAQWTETADEAVLYPRLPPGAYTFRVQAATNPAFRHAAEAVYSFSIARPVYRRWWFLALCALGLVALLYSLWHARERRLAHLNRLREERLRFEYEYLKTQVNPHFLFNALNTLAGLIEENQERATEYTLRLSALYRSIIQHSAKTTISLEKELCLLEDYAYVQHQRFGEALVITNRIPPTIAATCKVVPLALQMLVENAIKHNVSSMREPLEILLEADEAAQWLCISNAIRPKISREPGAGLGLENIRSRYRLLTAKPVAVGGHDGIWVVTLPLL